jgi:hypothetical protein
MRNAHDEGVLFERLTTKWLLLTTKAAATSLVPRHRPTDD